MDPVNVATDAKPSLRDQLSAAFEQTETPVDKPEADKTPDGKPRDKEAPGPTAKVGRDETGKFAKQEKQEKQGETQKPATEPKSATPPKRPASWKKDYWEKYDALDEELRNYILQREDEATRGISNYKAEAERAKVLWDAIAPFQSELEQYKIDPAQHIQNLFSAHRTLALASPQEKLQMFARLAQEYQVPIQSLVAAFTGQQVQGAYDPRVDQLWQELSGLKGTLEQERRTVQQREEEAVRNEVQEFAANTEKFPHFEQVRQRMAGLLQAGEADDLESAYEKAVRLDDTLFEQLAEQRHSAKLEAQAKAKDEAAKAARANAPQVRSSSPGPQGGEKPKGLRAQLTAAFDELSGSGGRI